MILDLHSKATNAMISVVARQITAVSQLTVGPNAGATFIQTTADSDEDSGWVVVEPYGQVRKMLFVALEQPINVEARTHRVEP